MEWMNDAEWENEWHIFFMLENGLVEYLGDNDDDEPLFKITPAFLEFSRIIVDMFENDEDK